MSGWHFLRKSVSFNVGFLQQSVSFNCRFPSTRFAAKLCDFRFELGDAPQLKGPPLQRRFALWFL